MTTTRYHLRGGEELEAVNLQNHFGAEAATTTVRSYSPTLSSLDRHFGRPPITFHRDPPPYSPTQSTLDRHFGAPAITFHRDPSYSSVSQHYGDAASAITFDKSHLWEASSLSYIPTLSSSETAVIPSIIIMGGPRKSKEDKRNDKRKRGDEDEQQPLRTKANNKDRQTSSTQLRMKPLTKNAKKKAPLDDDDDDDTLTSREYSKTSKGHSAKRVTQSPLISSSDEEVNEEEEDNDIHAGGDGEDSDDSDDDNVNVNDDDDSQGGYSNNNGGLVEEDEEGGSGTVDVLLELQHLRKENRVMKKRIAKYQLDLACSVQSKGKKKKNYTQDQQQMLSETYSSVKKVFRFVKFAESGWNVYSVKEGTVCNKVMSDVKLPAGISDNGKRQMWEGLIKPSLGRYLTKCKNAMLQKMRERHMGKNCL